MEGAKGSVKWTWCFHDWMGFRWGSSTLGSWLGRIGIWLGRIGILKTRDCEFILDIAYRPLLPSAFYCLATACVQPSLTIQAACQHGDMDVTVCLAAVSLRPCFEIPILARSLELNSRARF